MRWWLLGILVLFISGCAGQTPVPRSENDQPLRVLAWTDTTRMNWVPYADSNGAGQADDNGLIPVTHDDQTVKTSPPSEDVRKRFVSSNEIPYRIVAKYRMRLTAYNSDPKQTDGTPWRGARGRLMIPGSAATNGLPMGTRFRIPEFFDDEIFTVDDRMAWYQPRSFMDIWTYHIKDAYKLGHPWVTIEVLGEPSTTSPP